MRCCFRINVTVVIVLIVAAGWLYTFVHHTRWSGSFNFQVQIHCADEPPRSVSCEAFGERHMAELVAENLLTPESRSWSVIADPFDGSPLTVRVACGGVDTMNGLSLSDYQFEYLVVIAEWSDGTRLSRRVSIPDRRVSRQVLIEWP